MRLVVPLSMLCVSLMWFAAQNLPGAEAQDSATSPKASAKADAAPATQPKKPAGRLPNHYGKLNLSTQQRAMIYGIQASYAKRLEALEQELAALKSLRDSKIESVLTPLQKQRLGQLTAESAARRKRNTSNETTASTSKNSNP